MYNIYVPCKNTHGNDFYKCDGKGMETKSYIDATIKNIEQNLSEKVSVKELSSECFISRRQLYRSFYSYTGHSVSEYIRKRKLSKALGLLKHSDMSFSDIAYSCGYSSVQALCRNVKSSLNLTPTEYRNCEDIYYFPLHESGAAKQISVGSQAVPQMIRVIYRHTKLTEIENKAVSYLLSVLPGYSGRLFGRNGEENGNIFCYSLYIEYNDTYIRKLSSAFDSIEICPGYTALFACISAVNDERKINSAWNYLYGYWLKGSMFERDDKPYFEEYIINDNKIKKLILHMPIRQRENFYKINIKFYDERFFIAASREGEDSEKSASNSVVDYITEHYPFLLKTQKEFYISGNNSRRICGMSIINGLNIPENNIVQTLVIPKGLYAVLEESCYGSGNGYEQVLLGWLHDNGFEIIGVPFSVYDISKGTKQNEIAVKSQVMIKNGTI